MGNAIASSQFYLYGKKYFTATGYQQAVSAYKDPKILDVADLSQRVYMVTGANSGIGATITEYLASKGATVHMVCRNKERGEKARDTIQEKTKSDKLHLLLGDCSLQSDVRRVMQEFGEKEPTQRLDGLVCNAGALLAKKNITSEGVEVTLGCHLIYGSYLMSKLALPYLRKSQDPRVIMVSSAGMYSTKFPEWGVASATKGKYDGTFAYAYAKRGQVLLAERFSQDPALSDVKFVTCHPGWCDTPGVTAALSKQMQYLQPLRSLWQGSEGICWLCVAPGKELTPGGFYLDRVADRKHVAGPFFSEGSATKNTRAEVDFMMRQLELYSTTTKEEREQREKDAEVLRKEKQRPLKCVEKLDLDAFMGKWYVLANIPTRFEKDAYNAVETYTKSDKGHIDVEFTFQQGAFDGPTKAIPQKAFVHDKESNSEWRVQPVWPVKLPYLIIECKEDSHVVIGYPSRAYVWIMSRTPTMDKQLFEDLCRRLRTTHQYYDLDKVLELIPQRWDGAQSGEEEKQEEE